MLVSNEAAPYSRGLRVARSLVEEGYDVEIAATEGEGLPREERDGDVVLRRYPSIGRWAAARREQQKPGRLDRFVTRAFRVAARVIPPLRRLPAPTPQLVRQVVFWPGRIRGWWEGLRRGLEPADLYHACGLLAIGIAPDLARDARARGRAGKVVYDVIDVVLESNNYTGVPAPLMKVYRRRERGWVARSDAIVTVNDEIADHLQDAWRLRERPTVLLNAQPRWDPPTPRPDLIRRASGIPPERKVVLFLGRLGRERGLEEAAEAVLRLADSGTDAALVMLGFGPWAEQLRQRGEEPRYRGRHFVLPAVHPDEVPAWTASADVSIIAVPANSLNQRLSTPNKFWESLTAGPPMVVGHELEVMRRIVEEERIGAIGDPSDPDDLARALRQVLDLPPGEYEEMRARALTAARERYHWEGAVGPYLALVRRLVPPAGLVPAAPSSSATP